MALDETLLREAKAARERLLEARHEVEQARVDYDHALRRLHAAGASLREIAQSLGLSPRRLYQVVEGEHLPGGPPWGTRRAFKWMWGPPEHLP